MGDFVTLTCPTCGGKLQITPDIDRFACAHCGNEHLVKRSEGVIAIQPLAESLTGLKRAADRTASEMAIRRLTEDLTQLQAAKQKAESQAAENRTVIAKHRERRDGCIGSAVSLVLTPLCFLAYTLSRSLAESGPHSSWLTTASTAIIVLMVIVGLIAVAGIFNWLFTNDPTPARNVAEENLRAAEAQLAGATQSIAQKQAEIAQHQQIVSLGS
jgi:hypothetical protein